MNIKKRYKQDVQASLSCRDDSEKLISALGLESEKKRKGHGFVLGWSFTGLGAVAAAGILVGILVGVNANPSPAATSFTDSSATSVYKLGKITTEEAVAAVSSDYASSLDNASGLEDFSSSATIHAKRAASKEESSSESSSAPLEITSYSADYVVTYATSWSMEGEEPWGGHDQSGSFSYGYSETDTEKYHIDVVYDEENPYLHSTSAETYESEDTWGGSSSKTTMTYVQESTYQNGKLYLAQSSNTEYPDHWGEWDDSGWSWGKSEKCCYTISLDQVYSQFSDCFYSVSSNLQMVNDRTKNRQEFADLLQNENGEILSVDGNLITLKVTYDSGEVTYVYDMENYLFRSAIFDLTENADCHDYDFNPADYRFTVEIHYTYNDVTPDYLSEEETEEYRDLSHYDGHDGYDRPEKDGDSGYHGGHDKGFDHNR